MTTTAPLSLTPTPTVSTGAESAPTPPSTPVPGRAALVAGASAVCSPPTGEGPPGVPGFIESRFSPLVRAVVDGCVADADPDGFARRADRTAVLLVTLFGDVTTTDLASRRMLAGQPHNPLLFYQSVPTSILGYVSRAHGIRGPITCLSAHAGSAGEALETAELMLAEPTVDQLLLIGVELTGSERTAAARRALPPAERDSPGQDSAFALLLRRPADKEPGDGDGHGDALVDLGAVPSPEPEHRTGAIGETGRTGPLAVGALWAAAEAARRRAPHRTPAP
ncbi:ketosynthase [Streptomyces sp. NPDC000594]|uniref:ketosynthase n=1 Tax=Streptomyces sp. NPDC000594 TaxID=3154261 RepID=UPI00331F6572